MEADAAPAAVAEVMRGFPAPWAVAGGWAMDLFLGHQIREHADVDVAVFRADQAAIRDHLRGWELRKVVGGGMLPWRDGEWLALPIHEVHATRDGDPRALELLLNERDGDRWLFRRDPRISLPLSRAILRAADGIPFFAPEIVLLYKSKQPREHDERDFAAVLAAMDAEQRAWLRDALEITQPGHPWLALTDEFGGLKPTAGTSGSPPSRTPAEASARRAQP
ncbi:MAG TPA: hypothetical protein VF092_20545 [Longimicrobium sp.]